jgi:hypothetical protein
VRSKAFVGFVAFIASSDFVDSIALVFVHKSLKIKQLQHETWGTIFNYFRKSMQTNYL